MRKPVLGLLALVFVGIHAFGEGLQIISSGGYQGIANSEGAVIIPPVYESLGWSDGTSVIVGEAIGYRENGQWGLINLRNKKITNARYAVLKPFDTDRFEAGVRGTFSHVVLRGLVNAQGETLLSFNYFSLERLTSGHLLVSDYVHREFRYGVISNEYERILPISFVSVRELEPLLLASNQQGKFQVYNSSGKAILPLWLDAIERTAEGFLIRAEGRHGLLDSQGQVVYLPDFKSIRPTPEPFAQWQVRSMDKQLLATLPCDSLTTHPESGVLIAHVNDASHILTVSKSLFADQQYRLHHIGEGFMVVQNNLTRHWNLLKTDGTEIAMGLDSLVVDSTYFFARTSKGWSAFNRFGRQVTRTHYEEIAFSSAGNLAVKKNGFWGWVDFQGDPLVSFKFDALQPATAPDQFLANYLHKWGVYTLYDRWMILPEYDELHAVGALYAGRKGAAWHILNQAGQIVHRLPYELQIEGQFIRLEAEGKFGGITPTGFLIEPQFDQISQQGIYYQGQAGGFVTLWSADGRRILEPEDGVQEVFTFSEGYFHLLKDEKHGFVDTNGKLRIANRYEEALPFAEGLAAVRLLGKWGFIDLQENLVIQPFYRFSSTFSSGLAIVQTAQGYGLITRTGEEVIQPQWQHISRLPTGNYLISDKDGKQGLADVNGRFILRPDYDLLEDTEKELIIASRGGKVGVLNYKGFTEVAFAYEAIRITGDYILLKLAP